MNINSTIGDITSVCLQPGWPAPRCRRGKETCGDLGNEQTGEELASIKATEMKLAVSVSAGTAGDSLRHPAIIPQKLWDSNIPMNR